MLEQTKTPILRGKECKHAVRILQQGGVVAIPTETVYGVAADATSDAACRAIYRAKKRPKNNPLIVHVCDTKMLMQYTKAHPPYLALLLRAFTPGPLTLILPKSTAICETATCSLPTVAIRIPRHRKTRRLIASVGRPLAAPSANPSGRLSPTTANMVVGALGGSIDAVIDGGISRIGIESTIIRADYQSITILRPGIINERMLRKVLGSRIAIHTHVHSDAHTPVTPGSTRNHYQPHTPLQLTENPQHLAVKAQQDGKIIAVILSRHTQYRPLAKAVRRECLVKVTRTQTKSHTSTPYKLSLRKIKERRARISSKNITVQPCYYYRIRNTRDYSYSFYSLCHFFDQIAPDKIVAFLPSGDDGHATSLCDRLKRAASTHIA